MYTNELIELSKSNVRFLVIGGIAITLSGYSRATFDLDLLVDLNKKNLTRLITSMGDLGYSPRIPVKPEELLDAEKRESWHKDKNMKVFTYITPKDPIKSIDIMIYSPINFNEAHKRRQIFRMKDQDIPVASLNDLINLKGISGRDRDMQDIKALKRLKRFSK